MRTFSWLLALLALPQVAAAFSGGAPGYSGLPGSSGTCNACHDAAVATPTLSITGPTSLAGGASGNYTLTISGGPAVRGGWTIAADKGTLSTTQNNAFVFDGKVMQQTAVAFSGGSLTVAFSVTAPTAAGTLRIYAAGNSANGNGGTSGDKGGVTSLAVTITAANAAPTVATAAAADPTTVTGTTTNLTVLGADDGGEANLTYTWAATGPAPVTFSRNGTNAAKASTATFTATGSYTFTCTIRDAAGLTVTSSRAVTVNAALTTVTVSAPSNEVATGQTRQFTAEGKNQFGGNITATYTWTASGGGTINASGLFTAGSTAGGPHTVTATSGSKSGTASITVVAANAPTVATAPSATPSPVTGTTAGLAVLGADDGGEGNLTYTWSAPTAPAPVSFSVNGNNAAKATVATFTRAGAYVLRVRIADATGLSVAANVNVTVSSVLTAVTVSPSAMSVALNASQTFTAEGTNQFGEVMSTQPSFTWTVSGGGNISSTGVFTAGNNAGGPHTVTATSGSKSGAANVTVTSGTAPTVATAAAAAKSPVTELSVGLSVLGADDDGEAALTYTWSAPGVSFSENATNAAKSTTATFSQAGNHTLQVLIKDAVGLSVTSSVFVVVDQTFTTLAVMPVTVTVAPSAQQPFTATAEDQFGDPMSPQPSISWNLVGGGAVSPGGLYTAPSAAGGPYSLIANSNGRTGIAEITVASLAPPTVMQSASASPAVVTARQTQLAVTATDSAGEANLRYKWEAVTGPAAVVFALNDSNSAKTTIARFSKAGIYSLRVSITNPAALTSTSEVEVTVDATFSAVKVSPAAITVATGGTQSFSARAEDQFGDEVVVTTPPMWSVSNGGTISAEGVFAAQLVPGGPFTVSASSGEFVGVASVIVSDSNDHTPPKLQLTGVAKDQAVGDVVELSVAVEDESPIALVSFIVDEKVAFEFTTAPFEWALDTRELTDGPHLISVMAKDAAGNASRTAPMMFIVDNTAPTVRWRSPVVATQISHTMHVKLDVADNHVAQSVRIIVGDRVLAVIEGAPWEASVDVSEIENGEHFVDAVARDSAGNEMTARLKIQVENTLPEALGGCSAGGAAPMLFALFALVGLIRRRRA